MFIVKGSLIETIVLAQDTPDHESWVGTPGRQKFLATPVVNGYAVEQLSQGPRGSERAGVGPGLPVYVFRVLGPYPWNVVSGWHVSLREPQEDQHSCGVPLSDDALSKLGLGHLLV